MAKKVLFPWTEREYLAALSRDAREELVGLVGDSVMRLKSLAGSR